VTIKEQMMTSSAALDGLTVMITGANRGLGAALVTEALARGARQVYAGTRHPLPFTDHRVTPLKLDVTDAGDIAAAADEIDALDVLVNNAGFLRFDDLSDQASLSDHLAVNLFGTYALTQALLPRLVDARGRIVNILSISALAALPLTASYSVSKAAAFSMTQSLRGLLGATGVRVHAVLAGPIDTDMLRAVEMPKSPPAEVARAIFDGMLDDRDEIFPDPMSATLAAAWDGGVLKAMERAHAAYLAEAG
jgi:NAD(P)-dependent dehydrogenase (short-subunit alcohol dehydrogenase family)